MHLTTKGIWDHPNKLDAHRHELAVWAIRKVRPVRGRRGPGTYHDRVEFWAVEERRRKGAR